MAVSFWAVAGLDKKLIVRMEMTKRKTVFIWRVSGNELIKCNIEPTIGDVSYLPGIICTSNEKMPAAVFPL